MGSWHPCLEIFFWGFVHLELVSEGEAIPFSPNFVDSYGLIAENDVAIISCIFSYYLHLSPIWPLNPLHLNSLLFLLHTQRVSELSVPKCFIVKSQSTLPSTFLLILNSEPPFLNGLNHICLSTHKPPSTSACDEFGLDYSVLLCVFPSPFLQSTCGVDSPLHFDLHLSHSFWKYFDDLRLIHTKLSLNYINNQNPLCSILK